MKARIEPDVLDLRALAYRFICLVCLFAMLPISRLQRFAERIIAHSAINNVVHLYIMIVRPSTLAFVPGMNSLQVIWAYPTPG